MRKWEEGDRARAAEVAAAARKSQEANATALRAKRVIAKPDGEHRVVVFLPLQLWWHPILRAFLPLLPREPRTKPQGLTPPLLPWEPQLRHLHPTLSHNQRRTPLSMRVWSPPLFRAPYLLREPLPPMLGPTPLRQPENSWAPRPSMLWEPFPQRLWPVPPRRHRPSRRTAPSWTAMSTEWRG